MTTDQSVLFGLLFFVFVFLVWGRWRYDLVAFVALLVALLTGVVPKEHAWAGVGQPGSVVPNWTVHEHPAINILENTESRPGSRTGPRQTKLSFLTFFGACNVPPPTLYTRNKGLCHGRVYRRLHRA